MMNDHDHLIEIGRDVKHICRTLDDMKEATEDQECRIRTLEEKTARLDEQQQATNRAVVKLGASSGAVSAGALAVIMRIFGGGMT